ncbi:hypothetical protein G4L39_08795 [Limisphaera ngatamarikiensis]|uniref:Uncharacterized protein n=1 Tax=Limisphaera ngatamarikiensis TaxID=1324935 RepID=A0A6M1RVR6_9BACT|nr:hypothetical protein [Limisphaera ngatamarikiensis]NGO39491.1 hypothetical protein [Limisphaera ngatamarikiensis]
MKVWQSILWLGATLWLAAAPVSAAEPDAGKLGSGVPDVPTNSPGASAVVPGRFQLDGGSAASGLSEVLVNRLVRELRPEDLDRPRPPNELTVGRRTYSGILVQALRSANPLELLNPWAPESAGSGEQNLVRDPATGKPAGLKLIALTF